MKFARRFYLKFVGFWLALATSLTFVLGALPGCATVGQHSAVVELVVSQATMRYIESASPADRGARARRVVSIAEQIKPLIATDSVSVTQLAQVAIAAIPSTLTPADRSLALSVINVAAQELTNKVGEGVLKPDQVVTVRGVLDSIENAALVYTGS